MAVGYSAVDDDLYREIILDHYRSPRYRGLVDGATVTVEGSNPLCGDEITLSLRTTDGTVQAAGFTGHGCSISQASASMMCETIAGRSVADVRAAVGRFRAMMLEGGGTEDLGDLEALQGVKSYPVRVKCAVLPWNALLQGLGEQTTGPEEQFRTHKGDSA